MTRPSTPPHRNRGRDCRVALDPQPTGIVELYSTHSRLQVGSPRGRLGLSSCTRPTADWDCRVALDPKPTTSRLSQGATGIVELHSTHSRLQVGSPRGRVGLSSWTRPKADYKSALPGGDWDCRVGLDPQPTTSRLSQGLTLHQQHFNPIACPNALNPQRHLGQGIGLG